MFSVKAIVQARSASGTASHPPQDSHSLFEAHAVRCRPSQTNGCNGPGQPAYVPPDWDLELLDADGRVTQTLQIGPALDHYQTVYVMNQAGKTIETIHAIGHY